MRCRACNQEICSEFIADGCPCNSPRGINHGLVPVNVCTCSICDPAQTGSIRSQFIDSFSKIQKAACKKEIFLNPAAELALVHTRVFEACRALNINNKITAEHELAEAIIKIMDISEALGLNLARSIELKVGK